MPKIYHRSNFIPKYAHGYDDFGSYLSIESAIKIQSQYVGKWYLDKNKEIELILSAIDSNKVTTYWKAKPNQYITTSDGVKRPYNSDAHGESYEHIRAKGEIIEKGCFKFKEYKIFVKDAEPEFIYCAGKYKTDVKAKLLDGTDCMIEVIKTSDLSNNKEIDIIENQILTFKIYIDDYGNLQHNKSKIIGNREIESIAQSIQKGLGKIAETNESIEELERRLHIERKGNNANDTQRIRDFKRWLNKRIEGLRGEIRESKDPIASIRETIRRIEETKQRNIREFEKFRNDISRRKEQILHIEREIEQYENEYTSLKKEVDKLNSIDWNDIFKKLEQKDESDIQIRKGEKINNLQKFLQSHKSMIFSNTFEDLKKPYIDRVLIVAKILQVI
jgi:hypothetical protein